MDDLTTYTAELQPLIIDYGMNVLGAILMLIVGWTLAGWLSKKVKDKAFSSKRFDDTLAPVFGQTVRVVILILTLLTVLGQFGVHTTSLLAVLGAAGLAIGLALQGMLSNVAAGLMILIIRPFKAGDAVDINGTLGVVDEIGLFITNMHTFDNLAIAMPNSKVWDNQIINYSSLPIRRVDLEFGIGYGEDMEKAMKIIKDLLDADPRVLPEPKPLIVISNLSDSSVDIRVRPWTESGNVWPLRYSLTKRVKEEFDTHGVEIPFPQRDVHLYQENS